MSRHEVAGLNDLAIYNGHAVAVMELVDGVATIRYCARDKEDKLETVPISNVLKLSHKLGNSVIGMYNMRIHGIKDCMQYIGEDDE